MIKEGVTIKNLKQSNYAIAIFHDKNSNNKFDKFLSIPNEKYGFSNNAPVFLVLQNSRRQLFSCLQMNG